MAERRFITGIDHTGPSRPLPFSEQNGNTRDYADVAKQRVFTHTTRTLVSGYTNNAELPSEKVASNAPTEHLPPGVGRDTPRHAEVEFFNPDFSTYLGHMEAADGSTVALNACVSPYSDLGTMVIASRPIDAIPVIDDETKDRKDQLISTHPIYDLSPEAQTLYWQTILTTMRVSKELTGQEFIATENCVARVKREGDSSRTIPLPHAMISLQHQADITPEAAKEATVPNHKNWQIDHLTKEQQTVQKIIGDQTQFVTRMNRIGADAVAVPRQTVEPYGYSLAFNDINRNTAEGEAAKIMQKVLATNHAIYARRAEEVRNTLSPQEQADIWPIPNPSYCLIIRFDAHDQLVVDIAPELSSRTGPLEKAGLQLKRIKATEAKADEIPQSNMQGLPPRDYFNTELQRTVAEEMNKPKTVAEHVVYQAVAAAD